MRLRCRPPVNLTRPLVASIVDVGEGHEITNLKHISGTITEITPRQGMSE